MISMGFKIQQMTSMYEFEDGSDRRTRHYTVMGSGSRQNQNHIVIDLRDIAKSVEMHREALAKNSMAFEEMCAKEMFVAMSVNPELTPDILGRIYAVHIMLSTPEEIEDLIDDPGFLQYVGRKEYARLKPLYDQMESSK